LLHFKLDFSMGALEQGFQILSFLAHVIL